MNSDKKKDWFIFIIIILVVVCIGLYVTSHLRISHNSNNTSNGEYHNIFDLIEWLDDTYDKNTDPNNLNSEGVTQDEGNSFLQKAYVTKVIDGDTLWVDIDGESYKVRFIGINCPEYTKEIEPYGKEATEYTTAKLLNTTVYLQKDISDTDSYDRLLRYVWTEQVTEANEENIQKYLFNYDLVYNGYAQSNYYKPNITLQDTLEDAENYAKKNKIGMWK